MNGRRLSVGALLMIAAMGAWGQTQRRPDMYASLAKKAALENRPQVAEREWLLALASARAELAALLLANSQPREAASLYKQAIPILGITNQTALGLAQACLQSGQPREATPLLRKLLVRSPRDPVLRRMLGEGLAASGETARALVEFERAIALRPGDPQTLYVAGSAALTLRDPAKAGAMYSLLLAAVPGAATHVLIGRLYRDFGYNSEATSHLQQALLLDPNIRRAHYYLGTLAVADVDTVRLQDAESDFRQELDHYPDDYSSNLYLGVVLSQQRRYVDAETYLLKAAGLQPESSDAFSILANAYFELRRYDETVNSATKAISLTADPTKGHFQIANTHYVLAEAWRRLGETGKANQEFELARQLKREATERSRDELQDYLMSAKNKESDTLPDTSVRWLLPMPNSSLIEANRKRGDLLQDFISHVQADLGFFYLRRQRTDDAAEVLAGLFRERPDYPGAKKLYGSALLLAGKYSDAVPVLESTLDGSLNDLDARSQLGQAYFRLGQYTKTVTILRDHPWHDVPTQFALATALVRVGQDSEAQQAFSALLAEHPNSAELQALLGQAAAEQRNYSSAISYYKQSLFLDPTVPEAHLGIALIQMRNGQLQESESEIRAELAAHPDDLRAKYYLSYILGLLQRHSQAEQLLRQIIAKRPDFPEAHSTLGTELLALHRPAEAVKELLIADKLTPSEPKVIYQLGIAYRKLGRLKDSESWLDRARQLKQQSAVSPSTMQAGNSHHE